MTAIRNPGDSSIGHVSQEAFESHWRFLGWEQVPDDEMAVLSVVGTFTEEPVTSLDSLSRDDLVAAADRAGVNVRANASKPKIIEQLREAAESGAVPGVDTTSESQEG